MSLKGDGLKLKAFTRPKRLAPAASWLSLPLDTRSGIIIPIKYWIYNQYLF